MILAILQARVSSTRLPGKVLLPILGAPMLLRQIERINRSTLINQLLVATSVDESDDAIFELCQKHNINCFRGSLENVLDRFYQAAKPYSPKHVVRLTGDCPLADPALIDYVITLHVENDYDYTSNTIEPTYPDGLDVEIMRFSALKRAWEEARLHSEKEHVTLYINRRMSDFRIGMLKNNVNLSMLRWTVDEQEDFELVKDIYEHLYPQNQAFSTEDILAYLDKFPQFKTVNVRFKRNEGLHKSLVEDAKFSK